MDLFKEIQVAEYEKSLPDYLEIERIVAELLEKTLDNGGIKVMQIAALVKEVFICSLPKSDSYPDKLTEYTFEIQFRTVLQHAWAEIEHDLGYKSEYSIPLSMRREFSRVAGLLELADETFEKLKHQLNDYDEYELSEFFRLNLNRENLVKQQVERIFKLRKLYL